MRSQFGLAVSLLTILAACSPTDAACGSASTQGAQSTVAVSLLPSSSGRPEAGSQLRLCCTELRNLVAAWLAGGRFELERALKDVRAAGIKTSLADIGSPEIADDENAALVYQKAWDLLKEAPREVEGIARSLRVTPVALWPKDDKRKLRDYVTSQRDAIDLTLKATSYEKCSFAVDVSQGFAAHMPHLAKMRSLARLLLLDATAKLGEGDLDGAIESSLAMRTIGRHVGSDPTLIGKLVEMACHGMAANALESVLKLGYPDTGQLERLLGRLDQVPPDTSLRNALEAETACGIGTYEQIRTGKISPSEMAAYVDGGPGEGWKSDLEWALGTLLWGWFADRDQAVYLDTMRQYIGLADRLYFEVKAEIETLDAQRSDVRQGFGWMAQMITPALLNASAAAARSEAEYQLQRLAVALMIFEKKRGRFPSGLQELVPDILREIPVDPFSGRPYVYRTEDGRFVVYSFDVNMVDDNGTPSSEVGRDKGDIVFRFAAKP